MSPQEEAYLNELRSAYHSNNLTLYLGAGVSVGNGLPSWDKLVLAMYFSAIKRDDIVEGIRPFPNYLFAIAEWHLGRRKEPLDITARKIRNLYSNEAVFLDKLQQTLYAAFLPQEASFVQTPDVDILLQANATLKAVAELCAGRNSNGRQVGSVVTYNYDNLLEMALKDLEVQPIWQASQRLKSGYLPVYHVHGYIPFEGSRSKQRDLVFTEEQYYLAAQNAYSWSNLIQIKHLSSSVGLMIGLSLTDRNMRRLLDALKRTPAPPQVYALLQKPNWAKPGKSDLKVIDRNAQQYSARFKKSGRKVGPGKYTQIEQIIGAVEESDFYEEKSLLDELGVRPIWYNTHNEIPGIIDGLIKSR